MLFKAPPRVAKYLEGAEVQPRQAGLFQGVRETLLAKIGADIVSKFLKNEFWTYPDGHAWLRVFKPELDAVDACFGMPVKLRAFGMTSGKH